jgi:hypothetical protein
MICLNPSCKKEIQVTEPYRILALDRPYMNLYFHPECYIEDDETLTIIIEEHFQQPVLKVKRSGF